MGRSQLAAAAAGPAYGLALGELALGLPAAGLLLSYGLVMGWVGLVGGLVGWLVAGLAAGLVFGLIGAALGDLFADPRGLWGRVRAPRSMVIRWPTQRELRNLLLILIALGLVFWLGQGAKFALLPSLWSRFMSPAFGLYLRCGRCLLQLPQMSLFRNPPILGQFGPRLIRGLVVGIGTGLIVGLSLGSVEGIRVGILAGLFFAFVYGLLAPALDFSAPFLLFTEIVLCLRTRRVVRFGLCLKMHWSGRCCARPDRFISFGMRIFRIGSQPATGTSTWNKLEAGAMMFHQLQLS